MDKNSELLVKNFHEIAKKGYIRGIGNSWGNIGLTFENEIGKNPDSKYLPDFKDIEIKCSSRFSRYPLHLFSIIFDGPSENETMRLTEKYGYNDANYPDRKVMFKRIENRIVEGNDYNFMFEVNRYEEKIYLVVYDKSCRMIEKTSYITFASLKEHIETKLKKIAYIKASSKKINNIQSYRYYSMLLYTLKSFDKFLELIDKQKLVITLVSRISKSGESQGEYKNKNVVFAIRKEDISKLFDCYYQYDYDVTY